MQFEWDEAKRLINLAKHGIDFNRARTIWQRDVIDPHSANVDHGELRLIAVGLIDDDSKRDRVIAVVYTLREGRKRIISARPARQYEREDHHRQFG